MPRTFSALVIIATLPRVAPAFGGLTGGAQPWAYLLGPVWALLAPKKSKILPLS